MDESTALVERWLPVPGYETSYEVSDLGRVRSLDRYVRCRGGAPRRHRGRLLITTPSITPGSNDYPRVCLRVDGARNYRLVHTLVLTAFVGPRRPGTECCHNNGDSFDNRLSNLRWDSRSNNIKDAVQHGVHVMARRAQCPRNHPLVVPNLVARHLRRNHRACLACERAHGNRQHAVLYGHPFDFQATSDRHYALIMGIV